MLQKRLDELRRLWEQLLLKLKEKGIRLQQALKLLQFIRQCDEVMYWIQDKVRVGMLFSFFDSIIHLSHIDTCVQEEDLCGGGGVGALTGVLLG